MTFTWLAHECYMPGTWPSHHSHMPVIWVPHDCHMTVTWVLHAWHMTGTWVLHAWYMTFTWLSHDCHMTVESVIVLQVWPGNTTFPDFTHPAIGTYWSRQLASFHGNISFDGLWIDMNEPSNFIPGSTEGCPRSTYNSPPFLPGRLLFACI